MIKLSKKWDYAIKSILYLAQRPIQTIKIADIASDLQISESFLRHIINDFEKAKIITSVKGRNGGVILSWDWQKINLYDVLYSVSEDLAISDCTAGHVCEHKENCLTTGIFHGLQKGFHSILKMYTLDKIVKYDH